MSQQEDLRWDSQHKVQGSLLIYKMQSVGGVYKFQSQKKGVEFHIIIFNKHKD